MLCYLAGPIDHVPESEATGWREAASARLRLGGIATFSPVAAFTVPGRSIGTEAYESIIAINAVALECSDVVLANLTGQSFGTPIECDMAFRAGVPVFGYGLSSSSIYRHRFEEVHPTVDEAIEAVLWHKRVGDSHSADAPATIASP